jgi:hypothetical protein
MQAVIVGVCVPVPSQMRGHGTNHEQPMAAERAGTLSATWRTTRYARGARASRASVTSSLTGLLRLFD